MGSFTNDDLADDWAALFNRAVDEAHAEAFADAKGYTDDAIAAAVSAWASYPAAVEGIATTGSTARFVRQGKLVTVEFMIFSSGAADNVISMAKPTASARTENWHGLGSAVAFDANVGAASRRSVTVVNASASRVSFLLDGGGQGSSLAPNVPWVWAAGDAISGMFSYREAA